MGSGGEGFDIGCEFGGVTYGKNTVRVGVKIERGDVPMSRWEERLCDKRIECRLVLGHKDEAAGQAGLVDDDGVEVAGVVDIKTISLSGGVVSFGATFQKDDADEQDATRLACRPGRFIATKVGSIPEKQKGKKPSKPATGQSQLFDDHDDVGPRPKATAFDRVASPACLDDLKRDLGAEQPLSFLVNFGATKGIVKAVAAAVGGDKILHLEAFMAAKPEYWSRDIKGVGPEKLTLLQDAHLAVRQQYPRVDDEDRKDIDHAFEEGRKAFGNADELGTVPNPDYVKGSPKFRAWELGFEHEKALFAAKVQAAKEGEADEGVAVDDGADMPDEVPVN